MRAAPVDDIGRAIEVVNTWDTLHAEPEQLPDAAILRRFLRWIGRDDLGQRVADADLARYRSARAELRAAFDAPDAASALERLNAILASRPVVVRAEAAGEPATVRYRYDAASGNPIDSLAATSAIALIETIAELGWARVGHCAGSPCTCLFVDRTKNRRRRYCSDQCNDRVAQSAHRRRIATA